MTSRLSRMSYARVLVEIDLRGDLQHSVVKVVYEAMPKFCNYCNVLGHTRLLCPKAAANATDSPVPSDEPTETVTKDNELAPCDASAGWTTVKPRRKANKHICNTPKGKEVITTNVETIVNLRT
ncbi:hypothetical protein NC653_002159 [Populus alba x Populus x berolinensis]|uniref:Zinc knuckle CX2CX4HX4C domain-containing protein n=1 Tax=Populus alba x Populus x berolinensis TaxID=444605 RepID=A0AAD6WGX3_9ROSI|nr:hypothetical protein NC653_002159 [Populus alba x Populus x berolinensis]